MRYLRWPNTLLDSIPGLSKQELSLVHWISLGAHSTGLRLGFYMAQPKWECCPCLHIACPGRSTSLRSTVAVREHWPWQ